MQNMPDNDLDELFKTAADNVQYEFKQEAWQSMHKQMKRSNARRRGAFWLGGLLVLLAVVFVGYYVWQPKTSQTSTLTKANQNNAQDKGVNQGSIIGSQSLPNGNTSQTNPQQTTTQVAPVDKNKAKAANNPNKNPVPKTKHSLLPPSTHTKSKLPRQGYTYSKVFNPLGKQLYNNTPPVLPQSKTKNNEEQPKPNQQKVLADTPQKNKGKLYATITPLEPKQYQEVATSLPSSMLAEKTMVATKSQTQQAARSRLGVIAQVAPDVSMVDKMAMADTRWNAGLLLEYEPIKNLSFSTGLNYSVKAYQASAEAYTPKDGQWKLGRPPENIKASCRVFEIPVNVRYYFHNQPKHRLFVSSGISSYWMLSENYSFDYGYPSNYNYNWGVSNQNKHMMSIVNLSVGWQKQLNKKWNIQAEPFLKIPLGKVGEGKVSLKTTGILLGLKYQLF